MVDEGDRHVPDELAAILADYLTRIDRNDSVSREALLAAHPEHRTALQNYFADVDLFERLSQDSQTARSAAAPATPRSFGPYELLREIGRGGMGIIYEAKELSTGRTVALKMLLHGLFLSADEARRFHNEARTAAALRHPNIVPIYHVGEQDGHLFYTMPLIEGASLKHIARAAHETVLGTQNSTCASVAELARRVIQDADLEMGKVPLDAADNRANTCRVKVPDRNTPHSTRSPNGYFRSVAKVMCDVATAVHHVHEINVLHRDVKPSNIMVTAQGEARLIDLGLAKRPKDGREQILDRLTAKFDGGVTHAVEPKGTAACGTPRYMAPEQFDGCADKRTDVWGLGVTLYELLALRPAFGDPVVETEDEPSLARIQKRIESDHPLPPRNIVSKVPRDLEAICLKALRKNPEERYQTADEFANDLQRWLNREPCHAWPPGWQSRLRGPRSPRALWLLCRRRPMEVIAATVGSLLVMGGLAAAGLFLRHRALEAQRRLQLLELQQNRLSSHANAWSETAWSLARVLAKERREPLVRDEAVGTLVGWDAKRIRQFADPAASLAFNAEGTQLLMGGWTDGHKTHPARVWDSQTNRVTGSQQSGSGPVAFDSSGAPLQLVVAPATRGRFELWDLKQRMLRRSFQLTSADAQQFPDEYRLPVMAISHDGALITASAKLAKGGVTAVWETATGEELYRHESPSTAVAFSPDGSLFATAADGLVLVRRTSTGEEVLRHSTGRAAVEAIDFGRDPRPAADGAKPGDAWRLAIGGAGGLITIVNMRDSSIVAQCRGSHYGASSLDFSPDGALLISTGRQSVRLWDVATGRQLLSFGNKNVLPAARFSPNGARVALCAVPAFGWPYGVEIWQLENGRGIQTLCGLAAPVDKVCYSRDERFLAALSHDWQVGIWELPAGELRHLLDVPNGLVTDNAALAFSADGSQFAFSAGKRAVFWDVATGQRIKEWPLPAGLGDLLAFHSSGKLLSVRFETAGKKLPPHGTSWEEHPRVVRLRNLLGEHPEEPIQEIANFNHSVPQSAMARDGAYFVIEGMGGPNGNERSIRAYEGPTGKALWSIGGLSFDHSGWLQADPSGRVLGIRPTSLNPMLITQTEKLAR